MIKFRIFVLLVFLACQSSLLCQAYTDSITIVRNYGVYFLKNGKRLSPAKLLSVVKSNPEAYSILKHAKDSRDIGTIMGSAGGFLVGFTLGRSLGQRTLDKRTFGLGAGLVLFSIPFSVGFQAKSVKAVKIYNAGLRASH